ncbi:MAG: hypothetical protein PF569_09920 [Candidatus Woesearchaeota archaeon]|nr:hypothetical protein [Candidatus Woesearchaeota archaeon]
MDAKDSIYSFTTQDEFENYLLGDSSIKKVPYIFKKDNFTRS